MEGTASESQVERFSDADSSEEEIEPPPEDYEDLGKSGKLSATNKVAKNKLAVRSNCFGPCKHPSVNVMIGPAVGKL